MSTKNLLTITQYCDINAMERWTLDQYGNVVNLFLDNCNEAMREHLERRLDQLREKGNLCKRPISAPLGGGLHELRGKAGHQEARLIYYFRPSRVIIFTHAFYKQGSGQKTNTHEINIANKIRHIIEKGKVEIDGINLIN